MFCFSCDFSEEFRLKGTQYEMCTYPIHTICYDNEMVIEDYISALSWNQKYIVAYSRPYVSCEEKYYYYIVEQCEPDTMVCRKPIYLDRKPWTVEKFQSKQAFLDRIEQLNIDTTTMRHWPK